jgi:hypothetical protein
MASIFPSEFADIEEIAGPWARESHDNGYRSGADRSMEEMMCFYAAVSPRAAEILEYCKAFDPRNPPHQVRALLSVMYSLIVVSSYVPEAKPRRKSPRKVRAKNARRASVSLAAS